MEYFYYLMKTVELPILFLNLKWGVISVHSHKVLQRTFCPFHLWNLRWSHPKIVSALCGLLGALQRIVISPSCRNVDVSFNMIHPWQVMNASSLQKIHSWSESFDVSHYDFRFGDYHTYYLAPNHLTSEIASHGFNVTSNWALRVIRCKN